MKFTFQTPTRLIFGSGRLDALGDEKLPGKKALLLTSRGKSAERTGALERTMKALERAGAQYVYCPMVESNPVVNNVMKAALAAREAECDFVVALGGGSVMDCGKAVAMMATNPGDFWDYVPQGTGGRKRIEIAPLPIVAISTTAGTGSEVDGGGDPVTETYNPHTYSTYTNMDGYWNLRTHLSYGLPVSFLKSNLNVMAGVNYTLTPTLVARKATDGSVYLNNGEIVGGERNDASRLSYDFRAVLGSNISENVDFTLSWHGAYNIAKNSLVVNDSDNKNRYFNHVATAAMKFVFLKSFTFTGNVSYQQNIGFTNDYDNSYVLCNVYLGKKVFRNRRGEVMFGVNDLFDQNTAFSRTTGSGYTQNSINSVIGRYYTVQFVYNLRNFGKRGSKDIKDYDGMGALGGNRRGVGRPPMGPPPGGRGPMF